MQAEQLTVSRKTQLDGRLEVSPAAAAHIQTLGTPFRVLALGQEDTAEYEMLECRCAKRAGGLHAHHFVASTLLRQLEPGSEVRIELDDAARALHVEPTGNSAAARG